MKIVVDWDRCEAQGACVRAAPASFHLDEKDHLHVLAETVLPEQRAQVEEGAR